MWAKGNNFILKLRVIKRCVWFISHLCPEGNSNCTTLCRHRIKIVNNQLKCERKRLFCSISCLFLTLFNLRANGLLEAWQYTFSFDCLKLVLHFYDTFLFPYLNFFITSSFRKKIGSLSIFMQTMKNVCFWFRKSH